MSITMNFNILFLVYNDYLVIRPSHDLKTIMNTKIYMIIETLPNSFKMTKGILKGHKVFLWESKVLQALLLKRKRTTPNKENSRKKNTQG